MEQTLDVTPLMEWLTKLKVGRGAAAEQSAIGVNSRWRAAAKEQSVTEWVDDLLARLASAQGNGDVIDRSAILTIAEQGDAEAVHLGSLVWGWGSDGRRIGKALESFVETEATVRNEIFELSGVDVERAWQRWWAVPGKTAIPGLGVAMGTKLLYFAGYPRHPPLLPLIYDQRVFATLDALGYHIADPGGMGRILWARDYGPYLQLCADVAASLELEADDVEFALFNANGTLSV